MCDFWKNAETEITQEQFEKGLQQFDHLKLVRFTGGEPLLCDLLPRFIKTCHSGGIMTSLITNGLLLSEKLDCLAESGLDQVVISVDGPQPELHNRLRGTEGLLEKIEEALHLINNRYPMLHTRVNTVVSHMNMPYLAQLAEWLKRYNIEQWSVIPVKMDGYDWKTKMSSDEFQHYYGEFQKAVRGSSIDMLGYSDTWAGNGTDFWSGKLSIRPKGNCHLVEKLSFYDPFSDYIYPCNCVPHRSKEFQNPEEERNWYFEHGHEYCRGCEPLNAYCADFPQTIETNVLNI
ncbi:MAG: radical SAM protein [Firmicutes bacterium]|nr:radical SAM protein [Bacillota bacterium]